MGNLTKLSILGLLLASTSFASLHAQTTVSTSTDGTAANPAPAGQAPDDVTNKITSLVHEGKYAEAQQLTTGLLVAYPNDQRLIKAKTLLEKSLAAPARRQTNNPASTSAANPDPQIGRAHV